ncbi:MAG: hypothetical protein H6661_09960 [Ardenticatenaceae bacterium]|nr:hypothetical protein [Ardenticatenaceae bacterium]
MQEETKILEIPKHWRAHVIPADEVENGPHEQTGEPYKWFVRPVGPWRLEVFPPEPDGAPGTRMAAWTGQWEMEDGRILEADAASLAEAAARIESMMAVVLTSTLMGLTGGSLPDPLWEAALALAED